jgi:hypothetical protein
MAISVAPPGPDVLSEVPGSRLPFAFRSEEVHMRVYSSNPEFKVV